MYLRFLVNNIDTLTTNENKFYCLFMLCKVRPAYTLKQNLSIFCHFQIATCTSVLYSMYDVRIC